MTKLLQNPEFYAKTIANIRRLEHDNELHDIQGGNNRLFKSDLRFKFEEAHNRIALTTGTSIFSTVNTIFGNITSVLRSKRVTDVT
ncbi:hypothetical protein GCM10007852_09030 [Agaribacter marinus]|uniref:Uncharacterized protein n=1 Tax=Agaribacter marinus TaxID=1431249 RepID=A0AA37WJN8_9ALTE|nr:hypothetical protein GCM10007852_09030 [Agaribacter marinus]